MISDSVIADHTVYPQTCSLQQSWHSISSQVATRKQKREHSALLPRWVDLQDKIVVCFSNQSDITYKV